MPIVEKMPHMTPDEYLEWETLQDTKHEYVNGEVFAMAGVTIAHATISVNLASMLRNHLRGGPCRVVTADVKVAIAPEGPFVYPDVVVSCDERDQPREYVIRYPTLIVEVLSQSTAAFDRGKKFAWYREVESVQEYVLVDTEERGVECFRKDANGHWVLHPFGRGAEVELESLGFRCSTDAVYEDADVR